MYNVYYFSSLMYKKNFEYFISISMHTKNVRALIMHTKNVINHRQRDSLFLLCLAGIYDTYLARCAEGSTQVSAILED